MIAMGSSVSRLVTDIKGVLADIAFPPAVISDFVSPSALRYEEDDLTPDPKTTAHLSSPPTFPSLPALLPVAISQHQASDPNIPKRGMEAGTVCPDTPGPASER